MLDLESEVHATRNLWISGLQECKGNGFFSKSGRWATILSQVLENLDFLDGRLPLPESTSHELFVGGEFNVLQCYVGVSL